ncbi:aspartate racemase, partial [Edwardsiella tarda ATCC 23685]
MKTIGLLGGMSWESSAEYYRIINQGVREHLGPTASASVVLWSFNFAEIEALQHQGDWSTLSERMVDAAQRLQGAGADVLLICTNTMHRMAPALESALSIPLIHIADPTAAAIKAAGLRKVGLLGTAFTMEQDFYKGRLRERHGLEVIVPEADDRATVHHIIYDELVAGQITPSSR